MNSILEHVWGESVAIDQIWARLCGMSPNLADKVWLAVLQAYFDESFDQNKSIFVLGGYVSPVLKWVEFVREWEQILPFAGLTDEFGQPYFHMKEIAPRSNCMEIVQAFYRIIEKHCELAISAKIDKRELDNAIGRVVVPNVAIDWGWWRNPYNVSFRILMDMFHSQWAVNAAETVLSERGPVDFFFDDKEEKGPILAAWDDFLRDKPPEVRRLYGAHPIFESDKRLKPLQAADLWAWWRRKWYENNQEVLTFGAFEKTMGKHPHFMEIEYSEDQLVGSFAKSIRLEIGPGHGIFDRKTGQIID